MSKIAHDSASDIASLARIAERDPVARDALRALLDVVAAAEDLPLWLLEQDDTPDDAYRAVQRFRDALRRAEEHSASRVHRRESTSPTTESGTA